MRYLALASLALGLSAQAGEEAFALREGVGRSTVEANCSICHSLDYVALNGGILDRKGWEASVNKMIKVMGAPVAPQDLASIVDYLEKAYGKR